MLLAEPLPRPPSSEIRTIGRRWRSTSREATIPTTPGCQPSPRAPAPGRRAARRQRGSRPLGRRDHQALGLAPLAVGAVELGGDRGRPLGILGEHQLDAGVGSVEAPGGVDPRREPEAERPLVDGLGIDRGGRHQGAQPGRGERRIAEPSRTSRGSRRPGGPGRRRSPGRRGRGRRSAARGSPTVSTGARRALRRAVASLWATARRAQLLEGIAGDRGWRIGQSGSSGGGWWWSVTRTSIPAAAAPAPRRQSRSRSRP